LYSLCKYKPHGKKVCDVAEVNTDRDCIEKHVKKRFNVFQKLCEASHFSGELHKNGFLNIGTELKV